MQQVGEVEAGSKPERAHDVSLGRRLDPGKAAAVGGHGVCIRSEQVQSTTQCYTWLLVPA